MFARVITAQAGDVWPTREDMEAVAQGTPDGIHDEGVSATGLSSMRLETHEVAVHA